MDAVTSVPPPRYLLLLLLFSTALFVSAAAMFVLQLMVGKMLLPLTGGTPAGWIVALAFFQIALLAGYAFAFLLSRRFPPRIQGRFYLLLLVAGAAALPVAFPHSPDTETGPFSVLWLLAKYVGIPAVALAATSSTLQRLFASTGLAAAKDPYFLYAASNLGSLSGLFLYPVFIETGLTIPQQSQWWMSAYSLLALLGLGCLLVSGKAEPPKIGQGDAISWKTRAEWIMLAFFPSSLLLGVTMHITTAILAAPLIWVIPMALYFLTYAIAFTRFPFAHGRDGEIHPAVTLIALVLAVMIMDLANLPWKACWNLTAFTIIALMYHIRLAQLRPAEGRLSEYYLMIALGGALNAFIAPFVFNTLAEYPLIAAAACLFHPSLRPLFRRREMIFYAFWTCLGLAGWGLLKNGVMGQGDFMILVILALTAYAPRVMIPAGIILVTAGSFFRIMAFMSFAPVEIEKNQRNFYGIIKVTQQQLQLEGAIRPVRTLEHGITVHGYQILSPGMEKVVPGYYERNGPFGEIFATFNPRRIAVTGLGSGAIACYGTPENEFTFFELDPAVASIAKSEFTFLSECHASREHRIILGDGRLEMAKLPEKFDLIVLDAFTSDMVPTHLLTQEAISMYLDHLAPGGVLLFHISSRYIHLEQLLAAAAGSFGLDHRWKLIERTDNPLYQGSSWVVMGRSGAGIDRLDALAGWQRVAPSDGTRVWTDDYSSILAVINR
jgi:SAM-dependent methyltransferase